MKKKVSTICVCAAGIIGAFALVTAPVKAAACDDFTIHLPVTTESATKKTVKLQQKQYFDVPLDYEVQDYIVKICEEKHIDPSIVVAMIEKESTYKADAIGDNGNSKGLLQIQARWHDDRIKKLGATDLLDPCQNIAVGVDYLAELADKYDGNIEKALVAYNAGETGAYKYWFSKGVYSSDYSKAIIASSETLKKGMVTVFYSDDPARDFERWDAAQNKKLELLPVCSDCGEHIQDGHYYNVNGGTVCPDCLESGYRVEIYE